MGTLLTGKVNSQSVVGLHLNARLVLVKLADGLHAFLGRLHVGFMHLVAHHTDDQTVKQRQGTCHDGMVTYGEGVEASYEKAHPQSLPEGGALISFVDILLHIIFLFI